MFDEDVDVGYEDLHRLMDVCISCAEAKLCNPTLPLGLIEEVFDGLSITAAERFFDYLESRADGLTRGLVSGQGKGLTLLRLCNELLRRLSKTKNAVFSGRILMYLATVYPLSERSGVNLRGDFNLDNVTKYEGDDNEQELNELVEQYKEEPWTPNATDASFYRVFWNMQRYFSNPSSLFPSNFDKLKLGVGATLHVFDVINSEDTPKAATSKKRKTKSVSEEAAAIAKEPFFPKYLTSTTLFPMELQDPMFRRQILVQTLILLQYLSLLTKSERERFDERMNKAGTKAPAVYLAAPTISEEQERWVDETRPKLISELERIPPDGEKFVKTVEYVMGRERNWVQWKNEGCASIERVGLPYDLQMKTKRRKADKLPDFLSKRMDKHGNLKDGLLVLAEPDEDEMLIFKHTETHVPTLEQLLEPLDDQIKSGEYEKQERLSQDPVCLLIFED